MNRFIKLFAFVPVIGLFYLFLSGTAYAFDDPLTVNSLSIQRDQYNNEVMSFDISGIEDYFFTDTYNTVYILSTNSDGNPTSDFYVQAYNLNLNNCDQPESGEVICNDINITSSGGTVQPDYVRFVLSDQYSSNRQDGLYYFVGPPTPTVPVTPGLTPGLTVTPTPTYTLSGTAYTDANKNGVQDSGETGFSGATVTLEETGQTTTTDANGNYSFQNVPQGTYTVDLTDPADYSDTTTNPATVAIDADTTQNFGIIPNPPTVGTITLSPNPVIINSAVTASSSFTDAVTNYIDTASWNWGDSHSSTGTVSEANGSGSVGPDSHTYTTLGSNTITLTVTDNIGQSSNSQAVIAIIPTSGLRGANLSGKNYSGANLSGQNISGSNLSNGIFNNVNFFNANMSGVNGSLGSYTQSNFTSANLAGANFNGANFTGANFTNAILTGANVSNANFTNVNFAGANLRGSNFHGATITGVTWSNTTCPNNTNSNNDGNTCIGQGGGL